MRKGSSLGGPFLIGKSIATLEAKKSLRQLLPQEQYQPEHEVGAAT